LLVLVEDPRTDIWHLRAIETLVLGGQIVEPLPIVVVPTETTLQGE
jgi:hypothetical protein